jgi:multidrug transporter EmrE-like cation transporter
MIPDINAKPPGQKLIKRMSARTKWMILAPVGLIIFSFGLWMLSEAAHERRIGQPTQVWVLLGLYSLVLVNGGIILFGEAMRFRILIYMRKETRRSVRQAIHSAKVKSAHKMASNKTKGDKKTKSPTKKD